MGYRHYVAIVSNEDLEKMKNHTLKDCIDKDETDINDDYDEPSYKIVCDLINRDKDLGYLELGKLYAGDLGENIEAECSPVFEDKETHEYYNSDYFFGKGGSEIIQHILNEYMQDMLKGLMRHDKELKTIKGKFDKNNTLDSDDICKLINLADLSHGEQLMVRDPVFIQREYNGHQHEKSLTDSCEFRKAIYEVLRIYKQTDWSTHSAVVFAW